MARSPLFLLLLLLLVLLRVLVVLHSATICNRWFVVFVAVPSISTVCFVFTPARKVRDLQIPPHGDIFVPISF